MTTAIARSISIRTSIPGPRSRELVARREAAVPNGLYKAHQIAVESASGAPPGVAKIVVQDVAFELEAGQGLGVIGPSGSGKSSLVRLLVGVWQPVRGNIRLDGAALDQWQERVTSYAKSQGFTVK